MPTLTDPQCVNAFVDALCNNVVPQWRASAPAVRAAAMHQAILPVYDLCGIPRTSARIRNLNGLNGLFVFSDWAIDMNDVPFNDGPFPAETFVELAETLYHEVRHSEQWWHMARLLAVKARSFGYLASLHTDDLIKEALKNDAAFRAQVGAFDIRSTMGIPMNIAEQAIANAMSTDDAMAQLANTWYNSVYGDGNKIREPVLTALMFRRMNVPGEGSALLGDFHRNIHRKYSGGLPEEADAWAVQEDVRVALSRELTNRQLLDRF